MNKRTKKNLTTLFLFSISILVITWCQWDTSIEKNNDNNNGDQIIEHPAAQEQQKLIIHTWCVWCGKCARTSPTNFLMSWKKAEVYSQENIDSQSVSDAIKNCPVWVIEIIEA